jgi:2-iminobutanoate/2-iminopropanoate deaminase
MAMKREIIRVEPLATFLDKYKAPASTVTKHGDTIYVSGAPPFDPETGEIFLGSIERQTELVLEQMKLCVETAGSSLDNVLKVNVYVTSVDMFPRRQRGLSALLPERSSMRGSSSMSQPGTAASTSRWIAWRRSEASCTGAERHPLAIQEFCSSRHPHKKRIP